MVRLFCGIVQNGEAFSVRVEKAEWDDEYLVEDLRAAIRVAMPKRIKCDAADLRLFLAKMGTVWLNWAGLAAVTLDGSGRPQGFEEMNPTLVVKNSLLFGEDFQPRQDEIHVLVVVPAQVGPEVPLPLTTALNAPDKYAAESSLDHWGVGAVHKIPLIWRFMSSLGGCTNSGEMFWRREDKQIASLLLDGWFRASTPNSINSRANKKSIVMGSPGIGKSTLLCVMAFHLVFKHKKNVLVYRRLTKFDKENCLLYLGYENGKVVQFAVQRCKSPDAVTIYEELISRQDISSVWLLLDGFLYQDIPEGLQTFKMLATSQQVDLKSQERTDAYCCLLPCWSKKDLWLMGDLIFKFTDEAMKERFYYSGGSVRGFTFATLDEIRDEVDDAIGRVDDVSNMLSNKFSALTGISQVDRLRHTFVQDTNDTRHFTSRRYWEQVIDSEYAVLGLSVRLKSDALFRIYTWAKSAGHGSLAGSVFEIYLHRLAADNTLRLYMSEYDPPERRKPNEPRHFEVQQVVLKNGRARCSGTASDHVNHLKNWRDDEHFTYWFPACHDFPNIDSIVKVESTSNKKSNVAYLQITVAADHAIDSKQLQKMNKIFYRDDVENAEGTEPPIYLAVCPDRASCEALILKPPAQVLAARRSCRVYVGFYDEAPFATAADGPMNDVPVKDLPPPPPFNLRKRPRTE